MSDLTPDPAAAASAGATGSGGDPTTAGPALPAKLNPRGYTKARRRTPRILAWFAVIASALVLVGSGTLYAAYNKLDSNIKSINIPILDQVAGNAAAADAGPGAKTNARPSKVKGEEQNMNFLVIGSDSREGATPAELASFGTEEGDGGQRSDTMLLVHIPADRDGAYVLSFPRDLYVEIPEMSGKHKINVAFSKGGPDLAIRTVESLTQIHIDHYLEVGFASFLQMVNALDGVEICIPKDMRSRDAALDLKAGAQRLNGPTALSYVRARTFDKDSKFKDARSDIGRIERQQKFLGAMIRRATSSDTLLNPLKLARFLDRGTKALKRDNGFTVEMLKDLGLRFRNHDPARVVFASVPIENASKRVPGGQLVATMDEYGANQIFAAIREGTMREDGSVAPQASASPAPKLTKAPNEIRVRVLNGTGISGKAREVGEDLTDRGFLVRDPATALEEDKGKDETVIRYGPDRRDSADTLAESIPGSITELDESLSSTLTVVVGSNYAGTRKVTIAKPRPSGSSAAAPAKARITAANDACS